MTTAIPMPPRRQPWRKLAATLALGAACLLPVQSARAFPVEDINLTIQEAMNWMQELGHWSAQLQNWKMLISSVADIPFTLDISGAPLNELSAAEKEQFIRQSCPDPGIGQTVITAVRSLFGTSSLTGDIAGSQRQICWQIKTLEIDKYNRTVKMLNRINEYGGILGRIQGMLSKITSTINTAATAITDINGALTGVAPSGGVSGSSLADLMGQMNQTQKGMSGLGTEWNSYQAAITADDAAISTLTQMQSNLAKIALNGRPSTINKAIQAAAFAAAFN